MAKSIDQYIKENKLTLILIGIIALAYYIYKQGKRVGSQGYANLPDGGSGIPAGWTPRTSTLKLVEAINPSASTWLISVDGTDEEKIFDTLDPLSRDQRTAVYNDYLQYTGRNLMDDLEDELSGSDLSRALAYFEHIIPSGRFARALVNRFTDGAERTGRAIINYNNQLYENL